MSKEHLIPYRPGRSGNPGGKPKGARDRISKAFLYAFAADFEENGVDAIRRLRQEDVASYVKVAVALQPKDVNVTTNIGESFAKLLEMVSAGHGPQLADHLMAEERREPDEVRH